MHLPSVRVAPSNISGKGVYAVEDISVGAIIMSMAGERVSEEEAHRRIKNGEVRHDDPFETSERVYLILDTVPVSINHSCEPNAGIRGENELFALRDIKEGEELFYDYSTVVGKNADDEEDWNMSCACGSARCRGEIGNWQTLPPELLVFYEACHALPDFILRQVHMHAREHSAVE